MIQFHGPFDGFVRPVLNKDGKLKELISPRKGFFDSDLTECGPPALITENGILLLYNGKNKAGDEGDKRYNADSYCAGQVLSDSLHVLLPVWMFLLCGPWNHLKKVANM